MDSNCMDMCLYYVLHLHPVQTCTNVLQFMCIIIITVNDVVLRVTYVRTYMCTLRLYITYPYERDVHLYLHSLIRHVTCKMHSCTCTSYMLHEVQKAAQKCEQNLLHLVVHLHSTYNNV
jgi:hypothetical protein